MRLNQFAESFGPYGAFEIDDLSFLTTMLIRMIEDIEIMIGFFAKLQNAESVSGDFVLRVLQLIDPESISSIDAESISAVSEINYPISTSAVVTPDLVRAYARPPVPHDERAIVLISSYLHRRLTATLSEAARLAENEGQTVIKLRHILPLCEKWPWPFNRWC
jgi:hypothetical protein